MAAVPNPHPIVVIGAGIAGLSAAWTLAQAGVQEVWLLEAASRPGGVMHSERCGGFVLEHGPDSFLTRKPAAAALCAEVGLAEEIIATLPQPGGARILHRGRLQTLPAGWRMLEPTRLAPVLGSPLFSWKTKAALAVHWRLRRGAAPEDESVGEYLRRRYGASAGGALAATVVGPLLGGVYGGDVEALSRAAVQPPATAPAPAGGSPAPVFASLRHGMGVLAEVLAARLPAGTLRLNCRVHGLERRTGGGYRVRMETGEVSAAAVIVATPAWGAAGLLKEVDAGLAALLAAVPYASSVNVHLGYATAPQLPAGAGFLAPRGKGLRLLACTFTHQKFPHRVPAGAGLLRLFYPEGALYGSNDGSDEEAAGVAQREVRAVLGVANPPSLIRVCRWPRAMPQYTVGHARRMAAVAEALGRHPGLRLAGNAYEGVGVPDCILSGMAAAQSVLRD